MGIDVEGLAPDLRAMEGWSVIAINQRHVRDVLKGLTLFSTSMTLNTILFKRRSLEVFAQVTLGDEDGALVASQALIITRCNGSNYLPVLDTHRDRVVEAFEWGAFEWKEVQVAAGHRALVRSISKTTEVDE